ncbi:MAG: hypothetical protein Q4P72_04405 [Eubacteriales bacterium]|nr:hypothetical protein [Eubacteriales bacterium]
MAAWWKWIGWRRRRTEVEIAPTLHPSETEKESSVSPPQPVETSEFFAAREQIERLRSKLRTNLPTVNIPQKTGNSLQAALYIEQDEAMSRRVLKQIRILAFVGASGTGKSTRALMIARDRQIRYIIDDGILIHGTRILAGASAKRAETRMESVRQAIFLDPVRAANMRRALLEQRPDRLMILGTSDGMIEKICANLWLGGEKEFIYISDVASEEEQRAARASRLRDGYHTIPVPSLEIKHEFSGYFSEPLSLIKRELYKNYLRATRQDSEMDSDFKHELESQHMDERTVVRPTFSALGNYAISDEALKSLVSLMAHEIDGVDEVIACELYSLRQGIVLSVDLALCYGYHLQETLNHAQNRFKSLIETYAAINVLNIHIRAARLVCPPRKKRSRG